MAYALSSGGSDWVHISILSIDQETGEAHDLEDKLEYVKFTSLMWTHDNKVGHFAPNSWLDASALLALWQHTSSAC